MSSELAMYMFCKDMGKLPHELDDMSEEKLDDWMLIASKRREWIRKRIRFEMEDFASKSSKENPLDPGGLVAGILSRIAEFI